METRQQPSGVHRADIRRQVLQATAQALEEPAEASPILPHIDPRDPATWPEGMQAHRAAHLGQVLSNSREHDQNLYELRRDVLTDAAILRMGDEYAFIEAAVAELMASLPQGSRERQIAGQLEDAAQRVAVGIAAACMDLLPLLDQLVPYKAPQEILDALLVSMPEAEPTEAAEGSAHTVARCMQNGKR